MIIDAHTHAWARWPYSSEVPDPDTRGGYPQLLHEMAMAGVDAAVVVSAAIGDNADNNDYVAAAVAACGGRLHHLVDFDSRWSATHHRPGAAQRMARLCDRLRPLGISHYLAADNDGWLRSDEAAAVFAEAQRRGLLVSLAASPAWFDDVCALAMAFPATPVLLNHLALAMLHPDGIAAGLGVVRRGAAQPNLIVKASGYHYGSNRPWDYPFTDRLDVVRAFYETWGPQRMVWASDHPASAPHLTYRQSLEVLREHAGIEAGDLPLVLGATMAGLIDRARVEVR